MVWDKSKIIAIDFDGTCLTHEYDKNDPSVKGVDIGAVPVIERLIQEGHKILLLTMRSGEHLETAVQWFNDHDIPLWGVNYNKNQSRWTDSRKVFAHTYIDDAGLGNYYLTMQPIVIEEAGGITHVPKKPYVNWPLVEESLEQQGFLTQSTIPVYTQPHI